MLFANYSIKYLSTLSYNHFRLKIASRLTLKFTCSSHTSSSHLVLGIQGWFIQQSKYNIVDIPFDDYILTKLETTFIRSQILIMWLLEIIIQAIILLYSLHLECHCCKNEVNYMRFFNDDCNSQIAFQEHLCSYFK